MRNIATIDMFFGGSKIKKKQKQYINNKTVMN